MAIIRLSSSEAKRFGIAKVSARPLRAPGSMNKWEADWYGRLKYDPSIREVKFEGVKLRLADRTFYTPDFMVITSDDKMELHEVKGFFRDDAAVKLKVAAEQFPMFQFVLVTKVKGQWHTKHL